MLAGLSMRSFRRTVPPAKAGTLEGQRVSLDDLGKGLLLEVTARDGVSDTILDNFKLGGQKVTRRGAAEAGAHATQAANAVRFSGAAARTLMDAVRDGDGSLDIRSAVDRREMAAFLGTVPGGEDVVAADVPSGGPVNVRTERSAVMREAPPVPQDAARQAGPTAAAADDTLNAARLSSAFGVLGNDFAGMGAEAAQEEGARAAAAGHPGPAGGPAAHAAHDTSAIAAKYAALASAEGAAAAAAVSASALRMQTDAHAALRDASRALAAADGVLAARDSFGSDVAAFLGVHTIQAAPAVRGGTDAIGVAAHAQRAAQSEGTAQAMLALAEAARRHAVVDVARAAQEMRDHGDAAGADALLARARVSHLNEQMREMGAFLRETTLGGARAEVSDGEGFVLAVSRRGDGADLGKDVQHGADASRGGWAAESGGRDAAAARAAALRPSSHGGAITARDGRRAEFVGQAQQPPQVPVAAVRRTFTSRSGAAQIGARFADAVEAQAPRNAVRAAITHGGNVLARGTGARGLEDRTRSRAVGSMRQQTTADIGGGAAVRAGGGVLRGQGATLHRDLDARWRPMRGQGNPDARGGDARVVPADVGDSRRARANHARARPKHSRSRRSMEEGATLRGDDARWKPPVDPRAVRSARRGGVALAREGDRAARVGSAASVGESRRARQVVPVRSVQDAGVGVTSLRGSRRARRMG